MNKSLRLFALVVCVIHQQAHAVPFDITETFDFTGVSATFSTPTGVSSVFIQAWGAAGGSNNDGSAAGGEGGFSSGNRALSPGEVLHVYVGGAGSPGQGGFNGGGDAGTVQGSILGVGGGGGGASDLRTGTGALAERFIVAAGGGGAGGASQGFDGPGSGAGGGGWYGGGGGSAPAIIHHPNAGKGGRQTAGGTGGAASLGVGSSAGSPGTFGSGGNGAHVAYGISVGPDGSASAGGDGGGETGSDGDLSQSGVEDGGPAGGGSSYILGVEDGTTLSGIRGGNGLVKISHNLPRFVVSSPFDIEFGAIEIGEMVLLANVISIANEGGAGTFIDLNGATFSGSLAFSVVSGDPSAHLTGNSGGGTSELFGLKFDATGLIAGLHTAVLRFETTGGEVAEYKLSGTANGYYLPEPTTLALLILGLSGFGFWPYSRNSRFEST